MTERKRKSKNPAPKRQGTLIIIGGHEDHDGERVILKEVARLVANGRLVLATVASHTREVYLEKYQSSFGELGIRDVRELYIEDRAEASHEEKLKALRDV